MTVVDVENSDAMTCTKFYVTYHADIIITKQSYLVCKLNFTAILSCYTPGSKEIVPCNVM